MTEADYQKAFPASPTAILASIFVIYLATTWIYSAYFSPLSKYPGPKLWGASYIPYSYHQLTGKVAYKIEALQTLYGPIVRTGPRSLSYIHENAWTDAYSKTRPQLRKDPKVGPDPPDGVKGLAFVESDDYHNRMRRNLSPAFSKKALQEQEPLLRGFFNHFISNLRDTCITGSPINIVDQLNFVTVDIVGMLTFNQSFDCLSSSKLHPWMENIFHFLKAFIVVGILGRFQPLGWLILSIAKWAPGFKEKEKLHRGFISDRLKARLGRDVQTTDFMTNIELHMNTPTGMSIQEVEETCNSLILGGSETVASALSGTIYHLLANPEALAKLQEEVRQVFAKDEDITFAATNGLAYLHAVLQEALRLFPPLPQQINRVTSPAGDIICSQYVPGNVNITVSHWAAYHSPTNFQQPYSFIPERWLPDSALFQKTPEFQHEKRKVFQPFSAGPRNCIGINLAWAEMHVLLAKMIWHFDWTLEDQSHGWMDGMRMFAVYEKPPLWIRLKEV